MKLLIDTKLVYSETYSIELDDIEALRAGWYEITEICDKLGIQYFFDDPEGSIEFKIYAQKITLDEIAMNELFADILTYFQFKIKYAAIGGTGCDMALVITSKE
jgi:hypothetical protein